MGRHTVFVPHRITAGLRRHAAAALPVECCGALMGVIDAGRVEVRTLVPLADGTADRYHIDAGTVLRLERQAATAGLSVVGFYHSHPTTAPTPSAVDLELAVPGYIYLIIGGCDGCVRGWKLADDRGAFLELDLRPALAGAA